MHLGELGAESRTVGFEVGDHAGVEESAVVAFERPLALGEDAGEPTRPLAELIDLTEPFADVALAAGRELRFERHDLGVEARQLGLQLAFEPGPPRCVRPRSTPACVRSPAISRPATKIRSAESSVDELLVTAGRLGLSFERTELATHLAQQVLQAEQVGLGRVEATLGLLLALAVLEDAGRLLDDAPPILRAGVEHRIDLSLAHDDVLLAADTGVARAAPGCRAVGTAHR